MKTIRRKKKDWKATLSKFDVHTKTGKEAFIQAVAKAFFQIAPAKARWITTQVRELNKLARDSSGISRDRHGRELYLRIRVPTELMLFIQRWIPEFGRDSEDITLLQRCWPDLAIKDRRQRKRMYVSKEAATAAKTK